MRKLPRVLLVVLVTAAAGFAAASIVTGKSLADVVTGTTATTTTSSTTTGTTTTGQGARRVTICHITGAKKHPGVTITVSQSAVAAHLRHGDHLGKCTGTEKPRAKHSNQSGSSTNHSSGTTTTAANPGHSGSGHGKGK